MYLSRLEIQGFKSFANKTALEFQPGITAVVGPNGSGKSNVADGIRWVLGEQSLKILRGKKSEDVIFAGSDKKSRLGVAEVSLYLNNEDHSAPIEHSEPVITRRVYRDGEGEYLINHQPARLQDIQLLLAQANFGQRTYSVIAQGMIDSLLLSGPQERKHLFDEAAGVRQFQYKKDQAVQKLTQAKDNLQRGEAVMQEIEPRLRSLTRQVRRLERRAEVERSLREKQTQFFAWRWHELTAETATTQNDFAQGDGRRATIAHELETIQGELETIEKERTASEVFTSLQKDYNAVLDAKNILVQELAVLKGRLELDAKQRGAGETALLAKQSDEIRHRLAALEDEERAAATEAARWSAAVTQAETATKKIAAQLQKLENEVRGMTTALQGSLPWPEARRALEEHLDAIRTFVDDLGRAAADDLPKLHTTASSLVTNLEAVVSRLAGGAADPRTLLTLQKSLLEIGHERQAAHEQLMEQRSKLLLAEHDRERLAGEIKRWQSELQKVDRQVDLEKLAVTDPQQASAAYARQVKRLEADIAGLDEKLTAERAKINNFNTLETEKKARLFTLQKAFRDTQHQLNVATHQVNELQVKLARLDQRREDLVREIEQAMGAGTLSVIETAAKQDLTGDQTLLAEDINHLRRQLDLIGGIDEQITGEYKDTSDRWEFLKAQSDDLHKAITSLESGIAELEGTIKKKFDTAFKKIGEEFNQYFRTLFRGGKAELVLIQEVIQPDVPDEEEGVDRETPDATSVEPVKKTGEKVVTGIEIKATPPGKKLQNVAMLSGGERALTSIALLCAIISNNPSPFVVLDEVDAALDEANSQRFAAILDHLAHKTQFITITHNRATMEKAGIMYGVTMGEDGVSQLLSVKMDEAEAIIRKHGNR